MSKKKILFILVFLVSVVFLMVLMPSVLAVYQGNGHWYADTSEFCGKVRILWLDDDSYKHEPGRPDSDQVEQPAKDTCRDTALTVWGECYNDERSRLTRDECDGAYKVVECAVKGCYNCKDYSEHYTFDCPGGLTCCGGECRSAQDYPGPCCYDVNCTSSCCITKTATGGDVIPYCAKKLGQSCSKDSECCFKKGHFCWAGKCIASCDTGCEGKAPGWYDPPFWGGCSDCTENSVNNCKPCGEALAYCDGCLWDTTWAPFRDEKYTGTGPGHKCPGTKCTVPWVVNLVAPPDNTWITYDPTFKAKVKDSAGDDVRAYFEIDGSDKGGWGTWVGSGGISERGPKDLGDCFNDRWRAYAQDTQGLESSWTSRWRVKVDKVVPSADISYPTGTIDYTAFTVTLTESDDCSGIDYGQIQITNKPIGAPESDWTTWADCAPAQCSAGAKKINDFSFTGANNYCYRFRYRTYDNAGNNSGWDAKERVCISLPAVNQPPSTPTLIAPSHNVWINYNPTFQASATDPNGDNITVWFEVTGHGSGWGSEVVSGGTSSWGPRNVGTCFQNWWRAYAKDSKGATSSWSGYWLVKVDKDNPTSTLDQENGISTDTSIWVNLSESDVCSGVVEGDVDVRINGGAWQNYTSTINNFTYTGVDGNTYEFRYQVKDNAGNWSSFDYDGSVTIDLNDSPTATNLTITPPTGWCGTPSYFFRWTFSDPNDDDTESRFDFQILEGGSPVVDRTFDGLSNPNPYENSQTATVAVSPPDPDIYYGKTYSWRVRVYDNEGADSGWVNAGSFDTADHRGPIPDFNVLPTKPSALEPVQFTDNSECYDDVIGGSDCTDPNDEFKWTVEKTTQGDPLVVFGEIVTATFSEVSGVGGWKVILEVTDSDGYMCSKEKSIKVSQPLPEWREVKPK